MRAKNDAMQQRSSAANKDCVYSYYYRGQAEWERERGWLINTCLDGQDTFRRLMDMFEIQ